MTVRAHKLALLDLCLQGFYRVALSNHSTNIHGLAIDVVKVHDVWVKALLTVRTGFALHFPDEGPGNVLSRRAATFRALNLFCLMLFVPLLFVGSKARLTQTLQGAFGLASDREVFDWKPLLAPRTALFALSLRKSRTRLPVMARSAADPTTVQFCFPHTRGYLWQAQEGVK
jgi:hypothetical protein